MTYLDKIYEIVSQETDGFDAIYEDYILELVGVHGLNELRINKLLEGCGSINGRSLFVLLKPRKGVSKHA